MALFWFFLGGQHAFFGHQSLQRCSTLLKIFFSTAFDLKLTRRKKIPCGKQLLTNTFEKKTFFYFLIIVCPKTAVNPFSGIFSLFLRGSSCVFCHQTLQRCSKMLKIFFSTALDLKLTKRKNSRFGKQKLTKTVETKKFFFVFLKNSSKSLYKKKPVKWKKKP